MTDNTDATKIFAKDAAFNYMKDCGADQISALAVLEGLDNKRFMLVDKKASSNIWKAFANNLSKMPKKKIKQFYLQNTLVDDEYFP